MKLARFKPPNSRKPLYGILNNNLITPITNRVFDNIRITKQGRFKLEDVRLLAPVTPSKIVLVGLNYKDHADEFGMELPENPIIFMKPATSIIGPNENIVYPPGINRLDYEAELALIIKKETKSVTEKRAKDFILGYTCLNDVTARDLQKKDGQWTRAKSFDTFCPIGPVIETELTSSKVGIKLYLNSELKQSSDTSNLIFSPEKLVSFVSGIMTLFPGDIIATGTPSGIGPMKVGDTVEVNIEGIGSLVNKVAK